MSARRSRRSLPAAPAPDLAAGPPGLRGSLAAVDARVRQLLAQVGAVCDDVSVLRLDGADPVLPTAFPVAEAAAVALGATGAVAASIWSQRTGRRQEVVVDVERAGASLLGFLVQQFEGPVGSLGASVLTDLFPCRDGRWIHLHGGFPGLEARALRVLGTAADREAVAAAVAMRHAEELEDALAAAGACGAVVRSGEEWRAHPQGQALEGLGLVSIERIGEAEPRPCGTGDRPLGGVRVLDLTRVLAGPTTGRTLAAHGAEVLLVSSPSLPSVEPFVRDTSHGKRSTFLDLNRPDEAATLRSLASRADVLCQSYRPGSLAGRGFGPEELAALSPGMVYVSISCYGAAEPWRDRAGWEQLAQSVSGLAMAHGDGHRPALIPAAACDYTTGYLGALGAMVALQRRSLEGGSWHVNVSLCQTARWIHDMGARCDPSKASGLGSVADWLTSTPTPDGTLRHLPPEPAMSLSPPRWDRPSPPLGWDPPQW